MLICANYINKVYTTISSLLCSYLYTICWRATHGVVVSIDIIYLMSKESEVCDEKYMCKRVADVVSVDWL